MRSFVPQRVTRTGWTELGATWNLYDGVSSWTIPGGDVDPASGIESGLATGATELDFTDIIPLVIDAMVLRSGSLDLLIQGNESAVSEFVIIRTSNDPLEAMRPLLEIEYLAPPELAIVDHGDGSGATAAITGFEAGANTILYLRTSAVRSAPTIGLPPACSTPPANCRLQSRRVTIWLTRSPIRVACKRCRPSSTSWSPTVSNRLTAAAWPPCRLAFACSRSKAWRLMRVIIEKVPIARNLAPEDLPTIIVSPKRAAMPADAGTNGLDDVHYDVLVAIIDRDNQQPTDFAQLERQLLWRQQIARAFRNQRLPGVPEVINSAVEPDDGPHEHGWKHELLNTAIRLRFTSREPRGF